MKPLTEKVDDVILLRRHDKDIHSSFLKQKHITSLQDYEVSADKDDGDEDDDQEDDAESHFTGLISSSITSSFPNPNYKGQLLQFTESLEGTDKGQMESCEVNTPTYKNGLFF